MGSLDTSPDQALSTMLANLNGYLVELSAPPLPHTELSKLPAPGVSLVSLKERPVGLGNRRGTQNANGLPVLALKGIRLDAVVRFLYWALSPDEVEAMILALHSRLSSRANRLRADGFLRVTAQATSLAESVSVQVENNPVPAWRKGADYSVLYEFQYIDDDGADSIIAQIPVDLTGEVGEAMKLTDEMTRWDNESAPPLVLRGRLKIGIFSALSFKAGGEPIGTVTLTRTFDGATGLPTIHLDLAAFLAAITRTDNPERHSQVIFDSLQDFLDQFTSAGNDVMLGDWNEDGKRDFYKRYELEIDPAIELPESTDRFEIAYQNPAFDKVAVVYLRAAQKLSV